MRGWGRWCERRRVYDGAICSYPSERTGIYDGSSLRAFVARVSAPPGGVDGRDPDDLASIGRSHDPSNATGDGPSALFDRGALGANVRMSLPATELAEPYTAIRSIAGVLLKDDDIVSILDGDGTIRSSRRT